LRCTTSGNARQRAQCECNGAIQVCLRLIRMATHINARYMRSVNGPRQKAAYVNEDVVPRIEIVNCSTISCAVATRCENKKTSRERVHDQMANCVAHLACIVYLPVNHEWNAAFSRP